MMVPAREPAVGVPPCRRQESDSSGQWVLPETVDTGRISIITWPAGGADAIKCILVYETCS